MEQIIVKIIKSINENVQFSNDEDLFVKGIIDSFAVVNLVAEIEESFKIEFEAEEIVPENFQSVKAIVDFLHGKMG